MKSGTLEMCRNREIRVSAYIKREKLQHELTEGME